LVQEDYIVYYLSHHQHTDFFELLQKFQKWIESKIKLGRVAEIEDIMGAVVFLASDASAMITGTSLLIDGGWTAD